MREPELCSLVETDVEALPRILWAEDNPTMREYVKSLLQGRYTVEVVNDGLTALASARANLPDLILADVMMPRLDGVSLVRALRSDERTQDVPIILVSGRGGEQLKLDGLEAGADDYLLKPFRSQELLARIKTHLELVRMRKASAMREARLRAELELALEAARLGYWQLNAQTGDINCSGRCKVIYGLAHDEELSLAKLLQLIVPDDRSAVREGFARTLESGSDYEKEFRIIHPNGNLAWLLTRCSAVYARDGSPLGLSGVVLDITRRKETEQRQRVLIDELNHRVRNTLTTVYSLATQSLKGGKSFEDNVREFLARLMALTKAHALLTRERWRSARLHNVLREALKPYAGGTTDRISLDGPEVHLTSRAALILGITFHELGSNAAAYGALSNANGRIRIEWRIDRSAQVQNLDLLWQEEGGPPVATPRKLGFGSAMVSRGLAHELGAIAEISYPPGGIVCRIRMPLPNDGEPSVDLNAHR